MVIEIIGSITGLPLYLPEQIVALLQNSQTELNYGSHFMGRPGTHLYSDATNIVKLRAELQLNGKRIRDWVKHTLELEQKLAVHHPHKCWFVVELDSGDTVAGNICPRLMPLHNLFATELCNNAQKLIYLKAVYQAYFQVASTHGKRLDEGLSNFGIDDQSQVYYLDDDIYSWDNFLSFAAILGVLVRNNTWLDETCADNLGTYLQQLVAGYFQDTDTSTLVAGKLRDIYMPNPNQQRVFDVIISKFQGNKTISKSKNFSDRYIAVLADVHANLPALEAVLTYLRQENIHQGIVLGDIVGYGPHPAACIERLQNSDFDIIKGNHDHAAVSGDIKRGMSSTASWCIEWTIPQLSPAHKHWLDSLPLELTGSTASGKNWLAVHGAPIDPQYFYGYVYEMTYEDNLQELEQRQIAWCFHGHSHIQGIYCRKKGIPDSFYKGDQHNLQAFRHSLICPGSVGQPRNGHMDAQFAILDQIDMTISFHKIAYPIQATLDAMKAQNFPESLTTRLVKGQ